MHCTGSGIPTPSINWLKNGVPLTVTDDSIDVIITSITNTSNIQTILSSLVIEEIMFFDDADYQCEANNTGVNGIVFKVISQIAHLTVQRE